jgi:4-amino-4-deoxy-L-arabinose transferase-like glycosyltransferase
MLLCVLVAAALRVQRDRAQLRRALAGLAIAGAAFVATFLLIHPYALIELDETRRQIKGQSSQADSGKLGQDDVRGWIYYVGTLGWGFGWLPLAAAVGGALVALRRDWRRALLLIAFPLFLYLFLGAQGRFFGRWLMPAYPMLCVLCGYGVVALADAVARRRSHAALAVAGLAALVCAQAAVASVRVDALLGREDTRAQALDWLRANVPAGAPLVVEPFVPSSWLKALDRPRWPVERPYQAYEKRLRVRHIVRYRERGHCWVVVGSTQKERGLKAGLRSSRNYYRALDAASGDTATFSPFRAGADPVEFSYDFSFNYHPRAYERPGPVVEIHRLSACP